MFGLRPGPDMFTTNASLVWAVIASMFIGNLILSNVPGPRGLRYTAGGELCEALYSAGPLTEGTGLNLTFWSYAGQMNLGAIACRRAVPDLRDLVDDFCAELAQLLALETR